MYSTVTFCLHLYVEPQKKYSEMIGRFSLFIHIVMFQRVFRFLSGRYPFLCGLHKVDSSYILVLRSLAQITNTGTSWRPPHRGGRRQYVASGGSSKGQYAAVPGRTEPDGPS